MSGITSSRAGWIKLLLIAGGLIAALAVAPARAEGTASKQLAAESRLALQHLLEENPDGKKIVDQAYAVLVFPNIVKGGLIIGGAYGEGTMFIDGKVVGYYNSVAASWGLQAGAQSFGYALAFMNKGAVDYLNNSDGWEIGSGPSFVLMEDGFARKLSSSTLKDDIYGVIFDQSGVMAGLGLEGSKITQIDPDN